MATIYASAPATALAPSTRSPVALVTGLAALGIGFAILLGGAVWPNSAPHPLVVTTEAVIRSAAVPDAVGQDAAWATGGSRLPSTSASTDRHAIANTTHHHRNAEQMASVRSGLDILGGSPRTSSCLTTDLERSTRAESAHPASIPLQRDPREALMTLAAVQHGGPGTWSGSCLMRRLSLLDPVQADSDDRIGNALVALLPVPSPRRLTGPR
jgi:hypothetical protein